MTPHTSHTAIEFPIPQILLLHQTHHRGQMTVLMRQAGLPVAGMYGPTKEDWAKYGMPTPSI